MPVRLAASPQKPSTPKAPHQGRFEKGRNGGSSPKRDNQIWLEILHASKESLGLTRFSSAPTSPARPAHVMRP
ncbi:hypothetical protein N7539_005972 [Penicillium diatomitis]|uniref:Uncharacterized protein n=1 Tax=Penicillium diatomitis TaxID=2819901 RepID=A0A9W9X5K5_9EURO|nr:uncharacterized protein N7539_005972 [Penicillium diatomitis]KAJ5484176.1 hypothetical protein N7539_005972 [Penicillium diatomitis]